MNTENELKIYSLSDKYVAFLRQDKKLSNVFDNKENCRTHTRKYIGTALDQNGIQYFIPFSSPKNSDYITDKNTGNKTIRKNVVPIVRMTSINAVSGQLELKGTLKISNMIPVPKSELTLYDLDNEPDLNYKIAVTKEYEFIKAHTSLITKNAQTLYNQKTKETTMFGPNRPAPGYLKDVVDFKYAEKRCQDFIQMKTLDEQNILPTKNTPQNTPTTTKTDNRPQYEIDIQNAFKEERAMLAEILAKQALAKQTAAKPPDTTVAQQPEHKPVPSPTPMPVSASTTETPVLTKQPIPQTPAEFSMERFRKNTLDALNPTGTSPDKSDEKQ